MVANHRGGGESSMVITTLRSFADLFRHALTSALGGWWLVIITDSESICIGRAVSTQVHL